MSPRSIQREISAPPSEPPPESPLEPSPELPPSDSGQSLQSIDLFDALMGGRVIRHLRRRLRPCAAAPRP
ncbi:MAG: hypothetical protein U0670_10605 [Anaerolineae bacterium]